MLYLLCFDLRTQSGVVEVDSPETAAATVGQTYSRNIPVAAFGHWTLTLGSTPQHCQLFDDISKVLPFILFINDNILTM